MWRIFTEKPNGFSFFCWMNPEALWQLAAGVFTRDFSSWVTRLWTHRLRAVFTPSSRCGSHQAACPGPVAPRFTLSSPRLSLQYWVVPQNTLGHLRERVCLVSSQQHLRCPTGLPHALTVSLREDSRKRRKVRGTPEIDLSVLFIYFLIFLPSLPVSAIRTTV